MRQKPRKYLFLETLCTKKVPFFRDTLYLYPPYYLYPPATGPFSNLKILRPGHNIDMQYFKMVLGLKQQQLQLFPGKLKTQ